MGTPLLSQQVIDVAMNMRPEDKMIDINKKDADGRPYLEKYILRKAFDTPEDPYLPEEVLWRQKEQFSDGVGYDWVDGLKNYAESIISDAEFELRHERFPDETPQTKEYYFLRSMFEKHYPGESAVATIPDGRSVACSTPEALAWKEEWANQLQGDISGRAAGGHEASDDYYVSDSEAAANLQQRKSLGSTRSGAQGRSVAARMRPLRAIRLAQPQRSALFKCHLARW